MLLIVLYFDLRLCWKICASSLWLCIWSCSKAKVISSRVECNLHSPCFSRDTCFMVWGTGVCHQRHPLHSCGSPAVAFQILALATLCLVTVPWDLTTAKLRNEAKSGLGRFHLMTGCCTCFTEVRWFYDKKGLHLRIKWNVQEQRYTPVSFWKLRCHSATNPPSLATPHLCPL